MRKAIALILAAAMVMCSLTACRKINYATDYPITVGEKKSDINGNWSVKKIVKDGVLYLAVNRNGFDKDPLDYIGIWVYDSYEDARKVYDKEYDFYKNYGDKSMWMEGAYWFTGSPETGFGYKTQTMYCIEDNVLLSTVIYQSDEPGEFIPTVPIPPLDQSIDRSILKPYIIENAATIRKTVIRDVLGYN